MPIEIKNVSFTYSVGTPYEKVALSDINLRINENEMIGIIGHTGSGKSTFVQHLNALLFPANGNVIVDTIDTSNNKKMLKTIRKIVGLVFQYPEHQLFEMTVYDDIAFGPKNLGLNKDEVDLRVKMAIKSVGLDESYFSKSPFELSGGQKRRIAIAGVIAMQPKYLILDEPTAGLDPTGRTEILTMIKRLNIEQGMTILFVSHSMEDIAEYVDRLIVFDKSKIIFDDTPEEVFKNRAVLKSCGLDVPVATKIIDAINDRFNIDIKRAITVENAVDEIYQWYVGKGEKND